MSFAALAVRTCVVQALRGQTLAGDNVEDSAVDPIGLATSSNSPVVSVSSDHEVLRPSGRSLMVGRYDPEVLRPCSRSFTVGRCDPEVPSANVVDVTLSVFLPGKCVVSVPGMPDVQIDVQQAGSAFAFDLIWREITRALALDAAPASGGMWADLWRRAVNSVVAVEHRSYVGQPNSDVHVPAREIVMCLDVLDEPAFGDLRSDFWPDFVAAVKTCPDIAGVAPVIEAAVRGDDVPEWRALAALLGLRPADMAQVSLGPLGGGPTDPLVPIAAITVDGRDDEAADGALTVRAP